MPGIFLMIAVNSSMRFWISGHTMPFSFETWPMFLFVSAWMLFLMPSSIALLRTEAGVLPSLFPILVVVSKGKYFLRIAMSFSVYDGGLFSPRSFALATTD